MEVTSSSELEELLTTSGQFVVERLTPVILEHMKQFDCLWLEMGICGKFLDDRLEAVVQHVQDLFVDMVNDEKEHKLLLVSSVDGYQIELGKLSQELKEEPYQPKEGLKLVALEKDMRTKLDEWNMEKYERLKAFKKLCEAEELLCRRLELPHHDAGQSEVPTKTQLAEIEQNNKYMENQLSKYIEEFCSLRLAIFNLWEDLEKVPETDLEINLAKDDSDLSFVLSRANIGALRDLQTKLKKEQKENFGKAALLREELKTLWRRLDIEEFERKTFENDCVGFKPSTIEKLKQEVNRLKSLKIQHVKKFIEVIRRELREIWDKCFFGEDQRYEFTPAFDENYTEGALDLHEHQVKVMRNYYKENSEIYKLVEKRETMWKKLLELERKENDPNRLFANRGGALLKELKTRNTIKTNLPKVEEDLKKMIKTWEHENEKLFMVYEDRYLDVIERQWATYQLEKDMHKAERQKAKQATLKKEMTFGTKPNTPVKRNGTFTLQGSPLSKKSKASRVNHAGFGSTTSTVSPKSAQSSVKSPSASSRPSPSSSSRTFRTPKVLASKLNKCKTPKRRSTTVSHKRKGTKTVKSSPSTCEKSQTLVTLNSTAATNVSEKSDNSGDSLVSCTSYDDFSNGLREQNCEAGCNKVILNSTDSTEVSALVPPVEINQGGSLEMENKT